MTLHASHVASPFPEQALPPWRRAVLKVGSSLLAADGGDCRPATRWAWHSSFLPMYWPDVRW